ncbi:unnamed protein product [Ambrosiozyma monospora]|uniref:Unnamed protein product n=1 Tax=Ambrosiozyma monospora TaxID=43982 RepID=A0A9W6WB53_AMBMO|nr:unnamed protein product [Ambrosiozyma monospora]
MNFSRTITTVLYDLDSPTVTGTPTAIGTGGTATVSGASVATSSTGDFNTRSMLAEKELKRILGNGKDTIPLRKVSVGNGEFAEESASLARFFERSAKDGNDHNEHGHGRSGRGRTGRSLSFAFGGGR